MPSFEEIGKEIGSGMPSDDAVRRKYLKKLSTKTGRRTVLYAANFASPASLFAVDDVQLFMAALIGVSGPELDLVLHSPGGSAEAVEQVVSYLRSKFTSIRVFVPQNAMSAATMLACAADEIVMGRHSALGPIDPQITFPGQSENVTVPAQSIIDEYEAAQTAIKNGEPPVLWAQKIAGYPPGFLVQCSKLITLATDLVADWLARYMFKEDPDRIEKARQIATWLADNRTFQTHARPISYTAALDRGLSITLLEDDQRLQESVLSLFHATVATFINRKRAVKIVENDEGKGAYVAHG